MNKDIVKDHWKEMKTILKKKWRKFTEDEVMHMQGTYEELIGSLQKKYGLQKQEAQDQIDIFMEENHLDDDRF
jgi:uncharacterized protein YjbJ (UPF0337 family)